MTARIEEQDSQTGQGSCRVRATLAGRPPNPVEVGAGTAFLLDGTLEVDGFRPERVALRLGDAETEVEAYGMPPPRSYGAGPLWWAMIELPGSTQLGTFPLILVAEGAGERAEMKLGEIELVGELREPGPVAIPAELGRWEGGPIRVAICMATYEPRREQLERQIDSIRVQSNEDWICVVSDDCSSPEALAILERTVAGDPRFTISHSTCRLGFYRNFERALRMIPDGPELVAFADQDDRWDPDKLDALIKTLKANPGAALAYTDMRIATDAGEILSDTHWYLRRNCCDDMASMLVANTVTGAASMFRRELLAVGLPFPPAQPGQLAYHDHWLALCALALGEIAYLDRPTYDYTRHHDSVTIQAQREWLAPGRGRAGRAKLRWRRVTRRFRRWSEGFGWRAIYTGRYLLIRQLVAILEQRLGDRIAPEKRRSMRLLDEAERSPRAVAWLLARALRPLIGRNETLARERVIVAGLLWRRVVGRRARRQSG